MKLCHGVSTIVDFLRGQDVVLSKVFDMQLGKGEGGGDETTTRRRYREASKKQRQDIMKRTMKLYKQHQQLLDVSDGNLTACGAGVGAAGAGAGAGPGAGAGAGAGAGDMH